MAIALGGMVLLLLGWALVVDFQRWTCRRRIEQQQIRERYDRDYWREVKRHAWEHEQDG